MQTMCMCGNYCIVWTCLMDLSGVTRDSAENLWNNVEPALLKTRPFQYIPAFLFLLRWHRWAGCSRCTNSRPRPRQRSWASQATGAWRSHVPRWPCDRPRCPVRPTQLLTLRTPIVIWTKRVRYSHIICWPIITCLASNMFWTRME